MDDILIQEKTLHHSIWDWKTGFDSTDGWTSHDALCGSDKYKKKI